MNFLQYLSMYFSINFFSKPRMINPKKINKNPGMIGMKIPTTPIIMNITPIIMSIGLIKYRDPQ